MDNGGVLMVMQHSGFGTAWRADGDAALTLAGRCRPFRIPPSPIYNLLELLIN